MLEHGLPFISGLVSYQDVPLAENVRLMADVTPGVRKPVIFCLGAP